MKSEDLRNVLRAIDDVEDGIKQIKRDMDALGIAVERLVGVCDEDEELLNIINRDRRWFQAFRAMIDDFSLATKLRRRIPFVESRLKEEESSLRDESRIVSRKAEDTRKSLEDLLKQFLR